MALRGLSIGKLATYPVCLFGKSTHISMISNSVTHLRSYTNSTIAGNSAPISPTTPRERQAERLCLRIKHPYHHIEWRVFECFVMFHNVLSVS